MTDPNTTQDVPSLVERLRDGWDAASWRKRGLLNEAADRIVALEAVQSGAGVREPMYLIRKSGAYYRPNSAGYTMSKAEAGRYTLEEAVKITHPNGPNGPRDNMSYELAPSTPTPSAQPDAGDGVEVVAWRACFGENFRQFLIDIEPPSHLYECTPLVRKSDYDAVCQERDQVRAELGTDLIRTEARAQQAEQENKRQGAALQQIIDMNVQWAIDKYGDADRAEDLSCVQVARRALNPSGGR